VGILREHYPCYRDWPGNSFWITRYDDVTSVFVDDANYESRPKRWFYGLGEWGRDFGDDVPVRWAVANTLDGNARPIAERIVGDLRELGRATDLASEFAFRFAMEMLAATFDVPQKDLAWFVDRYWRMQRGYLWDPRARADGRQAITEMVDYMRPLVEARRAEPGSDAVSAMVTLGASAEDVVVTLLESDHETLPGAMANLWFLLITNPQQFATVREDRRLMRFAYQETLRHSTPVVMAKRFARHEVERFGRLLPEGALLILSSAAANRDPRQFDEPDRFDVTRTDLCQREPRGSFRADGLPAGISFGTGKPSKHPAVPEDRPRSSWALTRDAVVTASTTLLERLPDLRLADGAAPRLRSLRWGEMHTCWSLPVSY